MTKRSTQIIAQDEKEALGKGATELGTVEANIQLTKLDENKYSASVIDADAAVEIGISDNGMSAVITDYQPPEGNGAPLDRESLKQQINHAGIAVAPKNLDTILERIENDESVQNLEIARGTPPREPREGYIELDGNTDYPVFARDIIGVATLPQKPRTGKGVDGRTIYPDDNNEPQDIESPENSGWKIDEQSRQVIAKGYGLVVKKKGQIRIKPLLKLSEDSFSLLATLYHLDYREEPITVERIKQAIADSGCRSARIFERDISKSLKKAKKQKAPQDDVLVATGGMEPQEPREGYIELYGNTDLPVFPDYVIGRVIPPTYPREGQTIE